MPERMGGLDEISSVLLQNIQEVEQKDENQVLAELAGETLQDYIYETFNDEWETGQDGKRRKVKKRKVKLSWVGTREVARNRGNLVLSDPEITDVGDNLRFVVKATDLLRNFTVFGGTQQPKRMKILDYDQETRQPTGEFHYEDDPFVFQKGLSKAQRNALNQCIPAEYATRMIDRFLRIAGKQPLYLNTGSKALTTQGKSPAPRVRNIKPREEWDKITKEQLKSYNDLQRIMFDLAKIQPAEMFKELGGGNANDMSTPAWESFLVLKERYIPIDLKT